DQSCRDDLWTLDASTSPPKWKEIVPEGPKPPARSEGVMVYDAPRDRLVLHGGAGAKNLRDSVFADLWTFDIEKATWTSKPCTAPGRYQCASALDPQASVLYVHGGFGARPIARNDLWSLDLATEKWTELEPGPKKAERRVRGHAAVWDPVAGAMVVFGGCRGDD